MSPTLTPPVLWAQRHDSVSLKVDLKEVSHTHAHARTHTSTHTHTHTYPYYMLGSVGVEWRLLTWIRYSLWIPLYPLGALAEAACVLSAIPLFEASQALSVRLPNVLNSSVHFPYVLYAYLAVLAVGVCINFRHMYKQRSKRFGVRKRKRA
ncbi:unnamed protein product [Lampetra fluviatilis]